MKQKIKEEFTNNGKQMIKPLIKGSAFITGKQELYVSKDDPFPEGYRLNDTWPDIKIVKKYLFDTIFIFKFITSSFNNSVSNNRYKSYTQSSY